MEEKQELKGRLYEDLINDLIGGLRAGRDLSEFEQRSGSTNRIRGASGYKHQIDVSLRGISDIYLFEAKCIKRVLGIQEILILGGRLSDISEAFPNHRVHASIISMKPASKNAAIIANHFNVKIDWVRDVRNFGISFAKSCIVSYGENVIAKSTMEFR